MDKTDNAVTWHIVPSMLQKEITVVWVCMKSTVFRTVQWLFSDWMKWGHFETHCSFHPRFHHNNTVAIAHVLIHIIQTRHTQYTLNTHCTNKYVKMLANTIQHLWDWV